MTRGRDLADETGLAEPRIRMILMNPLYNGCGRRHRRTDRESRKPAPWPRQSSRQTYRMRGQFWACDP